MGGPAMRLLCTWHIDRAWRTNLPSIKGNSELEEVVYKTLRPLMEISSKDEFSAQLQAFLDTGTESDSTADFAKYFEETYAHHPEMWAYTVKSRR